MNRRLPPSPSAMPAEDLARDDARVAAGAHQRPEADRGGDPVGRLARDRLGLVERRPDRREHVRAGVAVGDRVDVQAVDLVDVRLEVGDRGPERVEEPGAVAGPAGASGDVRPAVGEVARPDRGSGRPRTTAGGAPPGWTRRPPTWMTSRSTSRPSAVGRRSGPPNRPGGRPRRPARRGRRRGRARGRGRRRGGRDARLGEVEPVEQPGRAGPPAKP